MCGMNTEFKIVAYEKDKSGLDSITKRTVHCC